MMLRAMIQVHPRICFPKHLVTPPPITLVVLDWCCMILPPWTRSKLSHMLGLTWSLICQKNGRPSWTWCSHRCQQLCTARLLPTGGHFTDTGLVIGLMAFFGTARLSRPPSPDCAGTHRTSQLPVFMCRLEGAAWPHRLVWLQSFYLFLSYIVIRTSTHFKLYSTGSKWDYMASICSQIDFAHTITQCDPIY